MSRLSPEFHEDDDPLVVDVSVYGSAEDIPCDIWPTEDEVSSFVMVRALNDLLQAEAESV